MSLSDPSHSARRGVVLVPLALLLAACLLSLALYRTGLLGGRAHFRGTAYEPAEAAPGFRLVDETGTPARLAATAREAGLVAIVAADEDDGVVAELGGGADVVEGEEHAKPVVETTPTSAR